MTGQENSGSMKHFPSAGEVLDGSYEILEQLSARGFKVKDRKSSEILVLHLTGKVEPGFEEYAKRVQILKHDNFLPIRSCGHDRQYGSFTVREFIPGQSLKDLIKQKGVLNQLELSDIFQQACKCLTFLRRKGIVHNKLKAGNLLIGDDYVLRIADPALSPSELNAPEYQSPEQSKSLATDQRSDIYALGCIMYESLSGQAPFTGGSGSEIALKHTQEKPLPFLSLVPARKVESNVETVIFRCLEKQSNDRYQLSEDLQADLKRIEEGDEIRPLARAGEINKNLLAVGAATILLVGAAGAAAFVYFTHANKENPGNQSNDSKKTPDSILIEEREAEKHIKAKDYAKASELLNDIEPQCSSIFGAESKEHLRILHKLAKTQLLHKEIPQARDSYTLLCEILRKSPGLAPKSFAPALEVFSIAKDFFEQGEFKIAEDSFSLAYNLERDYANKKSEIEYEILIWKGKSEAKGNNFHDAAASYKRAIELLQSKFNNPQKLGFALHEYGRAQIGIGSSGDGLSTKDRKNAERALQDALEMKKAEKDSRAISAIQEDLKALAGVPDAVNPLN